MISVSVCLYVCLSVDSYVSKTTHSYFTKFSVHVTCGPGLLLLQRQYNTLSTFGFVNDVMLSHNGANGPESKTTCIFHLVGQVLAGGTSRTSTLFGRVRQVAAPKARTAVTHCILLKIWFIKLIMSVYHLYYWKMFLLINVAIIIAWNKDVSKKWQYLVIIFTSVFKPI